MRLHLRHPLKLRRRIPAFGVTAAASHAGVAGRAWRWPRRGPSGKRRAGRPSGASRGGAPHRSRVRHRCGWRAGSEWLSRPEPRASRGRDGLEARGGGASGPGAPAPWTGGSGAVAPRRTPAAGHADPGSTEARPVPRARGAPADAAEGTAREPGAGRDRGRTLQGGLSPRPCRSRASPAGPGLRPRPLADPGRRAGAGAGPPGAQRTLPSARRCFGARPAVRHGLHMRPLDARATIARWPGALRDPRASDRCRPATRPALGYPVSVAA